MKVARPPKMMEAQVLRDLIHTLLKEQLGKPNHLPSNTVPKTDALINFQRI